MTLAPSRRAVLAGAAALAALPPSTPALAAEHGGIAAGRFALPPLSGGAGRFAPVLSAETLAEHYDGLHAGIVRRLNRPDVLLRYSGRDLAEVVASARQAGDAEVLTAAAEHYNHTQYWQVLNAAGGRSLPEPLADALGGPIATPAALRDALAAAASAHFGSGWAWLALGPDGGLAIATTPAGETLLGTSLRPLLGIDLWEHAYYGDHRNDRIGYVTALLVGLVDWTVVGNRLTAARA